MGKERNAGGWSLNYKDGPKKVGRGTPPVNDGLTHNQRSRLIKAGLYKEYLNDWWKKGKSYDDFQEMRAEREQNFRYLRGRAKDDGLSRGKRRYRRKKESTKRMVSEGVAFEDTPLGKAYEARDAYMTSPKQCKMCPLVAKNYGDLRAHVHRAHSYEIVQLAAEMTDEDLQNLKILRDVHDGDLQFRAARYMKITGSSLGTFVRWTGKGKDSSITNVLIDRPSISTKGIAHGLKWEQEAIRQFSRIYNVPNVVAENRHFSHPSGILGATTDGLIGDHGLIEVKCPTFSIPEILKKRWCYLEICALGDTGAMRLKRNSDYFYQIILQLICSQRAYLEFVIAYRDNNLVTKNEDDRWTLWKETILYTEAAWHWHFIEEKVTTVYDYAAGLITIPKAPESQEE